MLALWAEMDLILADEFRDGNVPAMREPLRVARQAFAALPASVSEYYFRGDAACYEHELLNWLRDEKREGGPAPTGLLSPEASFPDVIPTGGRQRARRYLRSHDLTVYSTEEHLQGVSGVLRGQHLGNPRNPCTGSLSTLDAAEGLYDVGLN